MAFDNEIQEVVKDFKKNDRGEYIRISKVMNKESEEIIAIDIRQYYINDNDELCPTKKGVRVSADRIDLFEFVATLAGLVK